MTVTTPEEALFKAHRLLHEVMDSPNVRDYLSNSLLLDIAAHVAEYQHLETAPPEPNAGRQTLLFPESGKDARDPKNAQEGPSEAPESTQG